MDSHLQRTIWVENEKGDRLEIIAQNEGDTFLGKVFVERIPYHVFFATKDNIVFGGDYVLDRDPDYSPKPSPSGLYLVLAPYAE